MRCDLRVVGLWRFQGRACYTFRPGNDIPAKQSALDGLVRSAFRSDGPSSAHCLRQLGWTPVGTAPRCADPGRLPEKEPRRRGGIAAPGPRPRPDRARSAGREAEESLGVVRCPTRNGHTGPALRGLESIGRRGRKAGRRIAGFAGPAARAELGGWWFAAGRPGEHTGDAAGLAGTVVPGGRVAGRYRRGGWGGRRLGRGAIRPGWVRRLRRDRLGPVHDRDLDLRRCGRLGHDGRGRWWWVGRDQCLGRPGDRNDRVHSGSGHRGLVDLDGLRLRRRAFRYRLRWADHRRDDRARGVEQPAGDLTDGRGGGVQGSADAVTVPISMLSSQVSADSPSASKAPRNSRGSRRPATRAEFVPSTAPTTARYSSRRTHTPNRQCSLFSTTAAICTLAAGNPPR